MVAKKSRQVAKPSGMWKGSPRDQQIRCSRFKRAVSGSVGATILKPNSEEEPFDFVARVKHNCRDVRIPIRIVGSLGQMIHDKRRRFSGIVPVIYIIIQRETKEAKIRNSFMRILQDRKEHIARTFR